MAGIFGRIFKQWAEEAVVNKLADSKHFQKVAVHAVKATETAQKAVEEAAKDPTKVKEGVSALWSALQKEAAKDMSKWTAADAAAAAEKGRRKLQ